MVLERWVSVGMELFGDDDDDDDDATDAADVAGTTVE